MEAFIARHTDTLSESADEMSLSGDAATEFDVDSALSHAQNAADLYEQMHSDTLGCRVRPVTSVRRRSRPSMSARTPTPSPQWRCRASTADQISEGADLLSDCAYEMTAASDVVVEIMSEMELEG